MTDLELLKPSLRQVAEHIICAVGDAEHEYRHMESKERGIRVGDACMQAIHDRRDDLIRLLTPER